MHRHQLAYIHSGRHAWAHAVSQTGMQTCVQSYTHAHSAINACMVSQSGRHSTYRTNSHTCIARHNQIQLQLHIYTINIHRCIHTDICQLLHVTAWHCRPYTAIQCQYTTYLLVDMQSDRHACNNADVHTHAYTHACCQPAALTCKPQCVHKTMHIP